MMTLEEIKKDLEILNGVYPKKAMEAAIKNPEMVTQML